MSNFKSTIDFRWRKEKKVQQIFLQVHMMIQMRTSSFSSTFIITNVVSSSNILKKKRKLKIKTLEFLRNISSATPCLSVTLKGIIYGYWSQQNLTEAEVFMCVTTLGWWSSLFLSIVRGSKKTMEMEVKLLKSWPVQPKTMIMTRLLKKKSNSK